MTNVSYAILSILLIKDTNICKYVQQTQNLSIAHSEIIFSKGVNVLNVNFGSGRKFYNFKLIFVQLGADVCEALPFFHAFTGCENVSSFYNHGKCKFFDTWMELNNVNRELTELFKSRPN